jgi:hypothetical protein
LLPASRAGFWLGLLTVPDDGGDMFLRNAGSLSAGYMALYPKKTELFISMAYSKTCLK